MTYHVQQKHCTKPLGMNAQKNRCVLHFGHHSSTLERNLREGMEQLEELRPSQVLQSVTLGYPCTRDESCVGCEQYKALGIGSIKLLVGKYLIRCLKYSRFRNPNAKRL